MSDEIKTKIEWSCKFSKKSYEIIEGYLRIVEHTNLAYVEPHKVIIDNQLYLFFNEQKHKDIKARSESIQNNLDNFDKDMQKEKDNSRSL